MTIWFPFNRTTLLQQERRTVLVCGSRTWTAPEPVEKVLNAYREVTTHLTVVHGKGKGADSIADTWGVLNADEVAAHRADWAKHGKGAGPIRNQEMLDEEAPDVVWAFVDKPLAESKGTADMVRRADAAAIPCYVVEADAKKDADKLRAIRDPDVSPADYLHRFYLHG